MSNYKQKPCIKISEGTKKLLDDLKIIPDESYEHVILRALTLLKETKSQ